MARIRCLRGIFAALSWMATAFAFAANGDAGAYHPESGFAMPPEPPAIVRTHPAFTAAPLPLIKAIHHLQVPSDWPEGTQEVSKLQPRDGVVYEKLDVAPRSVDFARHAIAGYRQRVTALGGMYTLFFETRSSSAPSGQLAFRRFHGEVVKIHRVQGVLFPLRVGNRLRVENDWKSASGTVNGTVEWKVVAVEDAAHKVGGLPGNIYIVEEYLDGRHGVTHWYSDALQYRLDSYFVGENLPQREEKTEVAALR
ncbi:MAG: hypothetical protein ACK4N4_07900 [Burkholderiales bacterium]